MLFSAVADIFCHIFLSVQGKEFPKYIWKVGLFSTFDTKVEYSSIMLISFIE